MLSLIAFLSLIVAVHSNTCVCTNSTVLLLNDECQGTETISYSLFNAVDISSISLPPNCECTNYSSVLFISSNVFKTHVDEIANKCETTSCVYRECFAEYSVYSGNYMINKCFSYVDEKWKTIPYVNKFCKQYKQIFGSFSSDVSTYHYISLLTLLLCISIFATVCISVVRICRKQIARRKVINAQVFDVSS